MINWIKMYMVSLIVFLAADFVWLAYISKNIYAKHLGYIMAENVVWWAAIVFYLLFVAGLVFFVISPALRRQSLEYAAYAGALFGLITYATYDLTNLATLKDWPIIITVLDLMWGAFVSTFTSSISYIVIKKMFTS